MSQKSTEIATAYVQIAPSFKGIKSKLKSEFKGAFGTAAPIAQSSFSRIGDTAKTAFSTIGKAGIGAIAAVGAAVGSLAVGGGIARALTIDTAKAKLKGLGNDTATIKTIMDNASAAVEGTAYALDEAASVAAMFGASGISAGDDMERSLKAVANVATVSGRSMQDIGVIFSSVKARGKLMGDDMLQLTSAGVPVLSLLAAKLGSTEQAVSEMVSSGKIDFQTFSDAMREGLGDSAVAMGETFTGALANVKTAIKKVGADFAQPLITGLVPVLNAIKPLISSIGKWMQPLVEAFSNAIGPKLEALADKITRINDQFAGMKIGGEGIKSVTGALGGLAPVLGAAAGALGPFLANLPVVGRLFTGLTGPVGAVIGIFVGMIQNSESLRAALGQVAAVIGETLTQLGPSISQIMAALGDALGAIGDAIAPILPLLAESFASVLQAVAPLIVMVAEAIAGLLQDSSGLGPVLVGAAGAFMGIQKAAGPATSAISFIKTGVSGLKTAFNFAQGLTSWTAVMDALKQGVELFKGLKPIASILGTVSKGMDLVKTAAQGLVTVGRSIAGVIRLIGAAMAANPIGAIITGITLLVAGFIALYNNCEWFRDAVNAVWDAIVTGVQTAADWISEAWSNAVDFVMSIWTPVSEFFTGLWDGIVSGIQAAWDWIVETITGAGESIWSGIKWYLDLVWAVWSDIWDNVSSFVSDTWNSIVDTVRTWVDDIWKKIENTGNTIKATWKSIWDNVSSFVSDTWNSIKEFVWGGVENVVKTVTGIGSKIKNAVSDAGRWLYDAGKNVIDGLIEGISSMISNVVGKVKEVANKVVNAAKSFLGINSPSRVFHELGEYTMEGYRNGLESQLGETLDVFEELTSTPGDIGLDPYRVGGDNLAGRPGRYGPGGATFNQTFNEMFDPQTTGRVAAREVMKALGAVA